MAPQKKFLYDLKVDKFVDLESYKPNFAMNDKHQTLFYKTKQTLEICISFSRNNFNNW